jgi:hypothetical protein
MAAPNLIKPQQFLLGSVAPACRQAGFMGAKTTGIKPSTTNDLLHLL